MQWFFTLIKFLFMLVISISGIWWHKAGLTKQIGTFHTLVFVVVSPIFIAPNPVSGWAAIICILLGIPSLIVYYYRK